MSAVERQPVEGATPPWVLSRWMKVVFVSLSPPVVPVSTPAKYSPAGFYPSAYRITWDAQQKEYRIALTQLAWRE